MKFKFPKAALVALAVMVVCSVAFAGEGEGAVEHPKKTIGELFEATGIVGWMLLGVSCAGTALVMEHFTSLKLEKLAPTGATEEVSRLIDPALRPRLAGEQLERACTLPVRVRRHHGYGARRDLQFVVCHDLISTHENRPGRPAQA